MGCVLDRKPGHQLCWTSSRAFQKKQGGLQVELDRGNGQHCDQHRREHGEACEHMPHEAESGTTVTKHKLHKAQDECFYCGEEHRMRKRTQ